MQCARGSYKVADLRNHQGFRKQSKARRMVQNGGVRIGGEKVADAQKDVPLTGGDKLRPGRQAQLLQVNLMTQDTPYPGSQPGVAAAFIPDKFVPGEVNRLPKAEEYASGKGINCGRILQLLAAIRSLPIFWARNTASVSSMKSRLSASARFPWDQRATRICTTIVGNGDTTEP